MARIIALAALTTLGLSDAPVHEPVHARGPTRPIIALLCVTSLRAPGVCPRGRSRSRVLLRCLDFPRYLPGLVVITLECWLSSTPSWEVTAVGIMPSGGAGPRC